MSRFVSTISQRARNFLPGRISLAMSTHAPETTPPTADQNAKTVIKSKYKDVVVKAGDHIYYLDRLKLASNSGYFEKLLLSPEWNDQNAEPINVPLDSQTFSSVVDVIYDSSWPEVLNVNNYVSVLKAKELLEVEKGHYGISDFISDHLENTPTSDVKVFELFKFIVENGTLKQSLKTIYAYLAKNLQHFHDHEEFLSLPVDHFVKIITYNDGSRDYQDYRFHPYHQDRNFVVEVCCNWICHDLENRLPLIVKVSNAALEAINSIRKGNDQCIIINLPDIDEPAKREVVRRYFKRLLNYGTVLDPGVAERPEDLFKKIGEHCGYLRSRKVSKDDKLKKYVKNGDLYDITVKVQGKSYKLHRSILELKSDYFKELFSTEYAEATSQCDEIPSLPNKDQEYIIEGIDEATFDFMVNYIYFGERPSDDEYLSVFQAAYTLKLGRLLNDCKSDIEYNIDEFDSKGEISKVLNVLLGKDQFEDLYRIYLKRHVRNSWPEISHKVEFYSIPWNILEDWLLSSDFYFDDAEKLLDMCSEWIMHDVKNRYHLIPQIAMAIKNYGLPDYGDYKIETPADLGSVSEKLIRDKLWEISSSLSLIPTSTEAHSDELRKSEEWPVFVTSVSGGIIDLQNINFDRISTMSFRKIYMEPRRRYPMSASIIKDNLFIMCKISSYGFILAYNIPSKKFIHLNIDSRIKKDDALLNCHNELYCGSSEDGSLLKYSFELNRWTRFSKPESNMNNVRFTSDGDKIYRLSQAPGTETDPTPGYNVDWFDFTQNQWISLSSLPSSLFSKRSSEDASDEIVDFTIIKKANPAVLLKEMVLWYDLNSSKWNHFKLPGSQYWSSINRNYSVITQAEDGIIQVFNNQLYHYSNSKQCWEFKKQMDLPNELNYGNAPYYNIIAVNRPTVRIE